MTAVRDPALSALQRRVQRSRRDRPVPAHPDRVADRDLHDEVLQRLYGVGLALQVTRRRAESPPLADRISDHLDQLQDVAEAVRRTLADEPSGAPDPRRRRGPSGDHHRRGPHPATAGHVPGDPTRGTGLAAALVTLTDTLVAGYDLAELLQYLVDTSVDLLDVAAAGLVLADRGGRLTALAATSGHTERLEAVQIRTGRGPCIDCYRTGEPRSITDLTAETARWPQFAPLALDQGIRSVHAVPMRLGGRVIGALNLFRVQRGELAAPDRRSAQALADAATIGILQHRDARDTADLDARLEHALAGRAVIDQATGILAQHGRLNLDQAFTALRALADHHHLTLTVLARNVVDRQQHPEDVLFIAAPVPAPRPPAEHPLRPVRRR